MKLIKCNVHIELGSKRKLLKSQNSLASIILNLKTIKKNFYYTHIHIYMNYGRQKKKIYIFLDVLVFPLYIIYH